MRYLLFALALLLCGCQEQTRSSYHVEGVFDDKPVSFDITGLANTAGATPNLAAAFSAATAGLRGDLAGVVAQMGQLVNKPEADPPYAAGGAAVAALISTLGLAYAKHRELVGAKSEVEKQRADAAEGWAKAQAAHDEALKLAKALPPDRVPS